MPSKLLNVNKIVGGKYVSNTKSSKSSKSNKKNSRNSKSTLKKNYIDTFEKHEHLSWGKY